MALGHGWDWYGSLFPVKPSGESNQSTAFLIPVWAGIYLLGITATLTRHRPDYSRLRYYCLNMQLPNGFLR